MNLKQLEAFVQVAEGGSFSKAAKQLFLTQPTISAHISSLEKELNARFFVRNTKEVKLSDDGKELYRYARQMIDLQKKIEERIDVGKLDVIASIENQETIKKSVKQGMGISLISRLAAEEEARSGDLLTFPIPKADQGRDINLVYNKNYQMSKSAERFIKVVKEVYGIEE